MTRRFTRIELSAGAMELTFPVALTCADIDDMEETFAILIRSLRRKTVIVRPAEGDGAETLAEKL